MIRSGVWRPRHSREPVESGTAIGEEAEDGRATLASTVNRRMKKLVLVGPKGQVVCDVCHLADRPHTRMRGVIGWRHLRHGEGVLLRPTFSIHTAFVRFPIDAVFLDRELKILRIAQDMKPWRLAGFWGANSVLELAAGECRRLGVEMGDRLAWGQI